mmetsp:Transcript_9000/g.37839  ORF Transcript_9000/g.37839 Transcript_9000/m.37839 type:complete len:210 (-) Transcript_9000:115-744(-)
MNRKLTTTLGPPSASTTACTCPYSELRSISFAPLSSTSYVTNGSPLTFSAPRRRVELLYTRYRFPLRISCPSTYVPFVEPRSVTNSLLFSISSWQCTPETHPTLATTSMPGPLSRPRTFTSPSLRVNGRKLAPRIGSGSIVHVGTSPSRTPSFRVRSQLPILRAPSFFSVSGGGGVFFSGAFAPPKLGNANPPNGLPVGPACSSSSSSS